MLLEQRRWAAPQDVSEPGHHVSLHGTPKQRRDSGHIVGIALAIVSSTDEQRGACHLPQHFRCVDGEQFAQPLRVDPLATNAEVELRAGAHSLDQAALRAHGARERAQQPAKLGARWRRRFRSLALSRCVTWYETLRLSYRWQTSSERSNTNATLSASRSPQAWQERYQGCEASLTARA
jgi:hypothetical protein